MEKKPRETPEKELLKLIEGSNTTASIQTDILRRRSAGFFSLSLLKERLKFFLNLTKNNYKGKVFTPDIRIINFFLKFLNIGLGIYLVVILINFTSFKKEKIFNIESLKSKTTTVATENSPPTLSILKAPSYYLEKSRERDIFSREKKKITKNMLGKQEPSSQILEATKDLKLVGIAWSADPDVIIEDTANKRTFFLKKGQLIDNKIRIKAIFKDKVILSYMGEEVELR